MYKFYLQEEYLQVAEEGDVVESLFKFDSFFFYLWGALTLPVVASWTQHVLHKHTHIFTCCLFPHPFLILSFFFFAVARSVITNQDAHNVCFSD